MDRIKRTLKFRDISELTSYNTDSFCDRYKNHLKDCKFMVRSNDTQKLYKAIKHVINTIETNLNNVGYSGQFEGTGSVFDGTTTGPTSDFDYIFVYTGVNLNTGKFVTIADDEPKEITIIHRSAAGQSTLDCKTALDEFKTHVENAVRQIESLNVGLAYGGYSSPYFGGARRHGTAITLEFEWTPECGDPYPVDVDLTVALCAPEQLETKLVEIVNKEARVIVKDLPPFDRNVVHIIPSHLGGDTYAWYPSTSYIERDLVSKIPRKSAIIKTWLACKIISNEYFSYTATGDTFAEVGLPRTTQEIVRLLSNHRIQNRPRPNHVLSVKLYEEYKFIPPFEGVLYKENTKATCSINSAAIKYQVLRLAFAGKIPKEPVDDISEYIYMVFEGIVKAQRHPFLKTSIRPIRRAAYASNITRNTDVGNILQQIINQDIQDFCEKLAGILFA